MLKMRSFASLRMTSLFDVDDTQIWWYSIRQVVFAIVVLESGGL